MKDKFLIVGAGVAGLSCAFRLEQKGVDFKLIDSGKNASSRIAAGMINPLVFRRMLLGWRVPEALPELKIFYKELEQLTGKNYLNPIRMRRAFAHEMEFDLWQEKIALPEYKDYLTPITEADRTDESVKNTFGTGVLKQAYYVSTVAFLEEMQERYREMGKLEYKAFQYENLNPQELIYEGVSYKGIVFCEGYQGKENPWFQEIPLQQTKGEVLRATSEDLSETESLNRKCFVLPVGNKEFKIGATFAWNTTDLSCTEEAKEKLLEHYDSLTDAKIEVIGQEAGIRPTVPDRRPLMGKHRDYPGLFYMNGLGTKGYLLAPLMSLEFVEFLLSGKELHPEVDLYRFVKKS
ncbi:MAG: FAD-binding oxidoreductase [Bacteroidetes bacterium]|nr:MAG: FAD-binding oxidoreductase [Bacteroidota bacterium]